MRVVVDTNVIISMLLWGKSLERLFNLVNERKITLCFSPETIDELFRVINYAHIQKQAKIKKVPITQLVDKLISASLIYYPGIRVRAVHADESDNRLTETAIAARVPYIISGEKHLTMIKSYENIIILTPAQFLKSL